MDKPCNDLMGHPDHQHIGDDHASHGHHHGLSQGESLNQVSDSGLIWAIVLNQFLTLAEVVAGLVSGSTSLLSDAAHNFSDANALLIAYIARRISRREADARYTFGYRRAEIIGALINLTLLVIIGLFLIYEGIERLIVPTPIAGPLMAGIAVLSLFIDLGTAYLLWSMSRGSINVRAAFVHNIVDALGSIAVLIAAIAIIWLDWIWVDSALTLILAGYVLWQAVTLFPQATRVLMEGTPQDLDMAQVADAMTAVDDVSGVHHVHIWELDEKHRALEAHVVLREVQLEQAERIKLQIKQVLRERFRITHSTLEMEFHGSGDCGERDCLAVNH